MTSATGRFRALAFGHGTCEEPKEALPGSMKLRDTNVGSSSTMFVCRATTAARKVQHDQSLAPGTSVTWDYAAGQSAVVSNFEHQMASVIAELRSGGPTAPAETWKLAGDALNRRAPVDLSSDGWVTKLANSVSALDD